jgi:hypothetical protein
VLSNLVREAAGVKTGCGKNPQCCHLERSEGSRSEYFQGNARFFAAAAPQNDSPFEFFRKLLIPERHFAEVFV